MALKVGELYGLLRLDDKGFFDGLNKAKQSMEGVQQKISSAGQQLTLKATTPIVGFGTAAVMAVSKFDDSMSKVQALSGATGEELAKMRDLAKELGSTTAHSASAAADAMGYLALAGWDTNQILKATPHMLNLASAAGMDLATAADIVSDTMSMFQMEATEAGKAADIFAAAQSKSNTNVQQLGEAMKYAGAAASAAGMDLEQTAAVMGVLANNGLKGSSAGTTFVSMLRDMKKNAVDGKIAVGDMAIALYDAEGNMRDLGSIMADIEEATKDMTVAQKDAALGQVFMVESMKGVNIMLGAGKEAYKKLEDQMYNSAGTAEKAAKTMEDNIGGAFRSLGSAVEGLAISFGEVLAPTIRIIAERLAGFALWFTNLPGPIKTVIAIIAALVAAIGPLLIVASALISSITTIIGILPVLGTAFTVLTGPVGLIAVAIAGLITIGTLLYKNWDTIKTKAVEIWDNIKEYFTKLWNTLVDTAKENWEDFKDDITDAWEAVQSFTEDIWNAIKDFFSSIWDSIKQLTTGRLNDIRQTLSNAWSAVKNLTSDMWNRVLGIFRNAFSSISRVVNDIRSDIRRSFLRLVDEAYDWGYDIIQGLIRGIRNMASRALDAARDLARRIANTISNALDIGSPSRLMEKYGQFISEGLARGMDVSKFKVGESALKMMGQITMPELPDVPIAGAGGGGVIVKNMYVRNESDITKVAQKLYKLQQRRKRGQGK